MKSKDVKDEEVVRIPIAFAMVKVMQTLPPHIMEANLPGYADMCMCVCQCMQKTKFVLKKEKSYSQKTLQALGCLFNSLQHRRTEGGVYLRCCCCICLK